MAVIIAATATPTQPAVTNDLELFVDVNDNLRVKGIDSNGNVHNLSPSGLQDMNNVHNGGFIIQQRVATASTAIAGISTTTRAGVVSDRWAVTAGIASNLNWAQIDTSAANETNLNARYYGEIICASAAKKTILSEFIINRDMMHLRGKTVRLQCKVNQKVGSNQAVKIGILQLNSSGTVDTCPQFISAIGADTVEPTWGANLVSIAPNSTGLATGCTVVGNFVQITTSTSWQLISGLFAIPANAKNLMIVIIKDTAGGTTDNIGYAEVGLYMGQEIRDWVEEPFNLQLAKCQAFYWKTFLPTTVPVQNAGLNTGEFKQPSSVGSGTFRSNSLTFPVPFWKAPVTIISYSPNAATAQPADETGTLACTAFANSTNATQISWTCTTNASTVVGNVIGVHLTVDAETVN